MDQQAFLAAIQDAVRRKQGGEDPEADGMPTGGANRVLPPSNPNDLNITPQKPDPEAAANSQINAAANARQTMNPLTGLPMSVNQPAPISPEDQQRQEMNAFKMKYLQQKAQGQ